jgi:peptide/nickel transport system permease protein
VIGPSIGSIVVVVGVTFVPHFGRVARARTLTLKHAAYLEADRALGASELRVLALHLLPNAVGPLVVLASMDLPVVITIEAGLSFLGVGVRPPLASWGTLLHDGYVYLTQSPWPALLAGGALCLATLGFTLLGEALRDALDPRARLSLEADTRPADPRPAASRGAGGR